MKLNNIKTNIYSYNFLLFAIILIVVKQNGFAQDDEVDNDFDSSKIETKIKKL